MNGRQLKRIVPIIAMFLIAAPSVFAQSVKDVQWWHKTLSQESRNSNIAIVAQGVREGTTGGSCKEWVRGVVTSASRKVAVVPPNDSKCDWRWEKGGDAVALATDRWDGVAFPPGTILQAQVRLRTGGTSPHTMIALAANAKSLTVIESNYSTPNKVSRRTATWADFKKSTLHYTLYQIK